MTENKEFNELLKEFGSTPEGIKNNQISRKESDQVTVSLPVFKYSFPQVITKKTCKEYRESFPQSNTSNVKAWHSDYLTHETTDVFDPLINIVILSLIHISEPTRPY